MLISHYMNPTVVKKEFIPITKKEAKQIELFGEAKNMDSYKSIYDLHINGSVSELDQFNSRSYEVGSGTIPIYRLNYSGSQN